jgi:UDP-hydrolysing UDP-N-acetyl-D-glucosamine 2-epimerase
LLVGDRYETATAAIAATLALVPIVHLHGGEETLGAFDNALRHAITKMSHLHLVSHPDHAERVRRMGEPADSIHVVGAPGLDNLHRTDLPDRAELEAFLDTRLVEPVVIVTQQPTTLGGDARGEARALVSAMRSVPATYIVTLPNADPGAAAIREQLITARSESVIVVEALGERRYFGLMRLAQAMLGNSSSALIEAPALELPAVNVGSRQGGRVRGANVIDAAPTADAIAQALRAALAPSFRVGLRGRPGPFGEGRSADRIVGILAAWRPPSPPLKSGPSVDEDS